MTHEQREWKKWLDHVLKFARRGDERAMNALSLILETELKSKIGWKLRNKGVNWQDLDAARHDVILAVRRTIRRLRLIKKFRGWLTRVAASVAKEYRPEFVPAALQRHEKPKRAKRSADSEPRRKRPKQSVLLKSQQRRKRPKRIGTKPITIDGRQYKAKVYAPCYLPAELNRPIPLLEDLEKFGESLGNHPNRQSTADIRRALGKLPRRWLLALLLVYEYGCSRTEAAKIMAISRNRIFNLIKNARKRLRLLLPGYVLPRTKKPESRRADDNAVARKREMPSSQTSELGTGDGIVLVDNAVGPLLSAEGSGTPVHRK